MVSAGLRSMVRRAPTIGRATGCNDLNAVLRCAGMSTIGEEYEDSYGELGSIRIATPLPSLARAGAPQLTAARILREHSRKHIFLPPPPPLLRAELNTL